MKTIFCAILILTGVAILAMDFPATKVLSTVQTELIAATTNATGTAFYVEQFKNHTFFLISKDPRTNVISLLRSLDNTNWITFNRTTNVTAATNEVLIVGSRWLYFRSDVSGCFSNVNVVVQYLGGQ